LALGSKPPSFAGDTSYAVEDVAQLPKLARYPFASPSELVDFAPGALDDDVYVGPGVPKNGGSVLSCLGQDTHGPFFCGFFFNG
jgi:hypothetical protein